MEKSKKVKPSSNISNKSKMMSENAHETQQPAMLSIKKKKKKKSSKVDTSLQSTLSSYISTSSSAKKKIQHKSNPTHGSNTKVSPRKEHTKAHSNGGSSGELSDHVRKRKNDDTTEVRTSKKLRLEQKKIDTVRNTQSNSVLQNDSHSEDGASSSPDRSTTSRSQEQDSILAPKSSASKRGHHSNISSDEGVDSGEELASVPINHLEEPHQQPEIDGETYWSVEQTEELIFMIQERIGVVKPKDPMSYRCRMKVLPWGDLPGLLHPPRTEEECKLQLQHMVENTKTVRNLFEMLSAYKFKPAHKKVAVMIPFRRFMLDRGDEITKLKGNWIVNARVAFDALPEEERRTYTDPYDDEIAQRKAVKPKCGRSTFQIFCATLPNVSAEVKKEKFQALTPKQKIPLIKQAVKEHKQRLKDFEAQYGKDALSKIKPPYSKLSKEDWKLFLENKGMPVMRGMSPYQLFLLDRDDTDAEAMPSDVKASKNALLLYRDFVRSGQTANYEFKFRQKLDEFSSNFKAWYGTLTNELWKEPAHSYYTEVTTSKGGVRKAKSNFKVTSKVQELEQSYVESTMIGKFCDEPTPLSLTAKDVFKVYAKKKNPNATVNDMNITWNQLPKVAKEKFTDLAINNIKEYKAQLKQYVKGISDHERRVYIGQNRVRFIRVFEGTDIFEKNYPCSEYPPFRVPGRSEKKSPTKKANLSKLDLDFDSIFKTSSATNGVDEESGSEEQTQPNNERNLSEESFTDRLPSTSTPGTVAKKGISSAKQVIGSTNSDQEESDSGSSSSESSDEDDNCGGNESTRYLDAVQKVHSKKLLEVHSETDSDESSESEEESPEPCHPPKSGRLPAPVQVTPKQPVASASGDHSSSSEEESSSSSSDENARVATKDKSQSRATQQAVKASSHHTLSAKTAPQHLSPMKQKASSIKTATPISSKLLQQTPKIAAQRQAESTSSDSSDAEEESSHKEKTVVKSALGRMKPSLPPSKNDSSSEDDEDDVLSAWTRGSANKGEHEEWC